MNKPESIVDYNREAWDKLVTSGNRWTLPVSEDVIAEARKGNWNIVLTPSMPVPGDWFPAVGSETLCLASGGGQQAPVLAAAGYKITLFDNSPKQLQTDEEVALKYGLDIKTVRGDMKDLSVFKDGSFDFVFNPCSTAFVPDVVAVYREVARILKPGGVFMTGFTKPVSYLFDMALAEKGIYTLKYKMPYSDLTSLDETELNKLIQANEPLLYGHSMESLINGQLQNGLSLTHLLEDNWGGKDPMDAYFNAFVATRAIRQ